ncbi:MAG: transposase [Patescibacteria group bacterium]|nr:transposase [Patescibacteria group bacterium]
MEGEVYHIYNRGVEKRDIFLDERDYQRFLDSLKEFNCSRSVNMQDINRCRTSRKFLDVRHREDRLVDVLCYTLMPNHYHLSLKSLKENGITDFMRKLSTGYTKYFNIKYQRSGHLFQSKFQRKEVGDPENFAYLTAYIHLNPVTAGLVSQPEYYKFSSYKNYINSGESEILILDKDWFNIDNISYKKFIEEIREEKEWQKKIERIIID